jgi:uncharacterized membrane protein YjdF
MDCEMSNMIAVIVSTWVVVLLAILLALNISARWELTHWQQIVHEEVQRGTASIGAQ